MNFQLTKEQEFVRKMVREFAETEVEPLAAEIDQEHRFRCARMLFIMSSA